MKWLLALLVACTQTQSGIEVSAQVDAPSAAVRAAYADCSIVISEISLGACAGAARHSESSPLVIGAPTVVDMQSTNSVALGTFAPPPGSYCSVIVAFGPADNDAANVTDATLGNSLRCSVKGTSFQTSVSIEATAKVNLSVNAQNRTAIVGVSFDETKLGPSLAAATTAPSALQAFADALQVNVSLPK